MDILEELKLFFSSLTNGAAPLQSLPEENPAYAIRTVNGYGVAIEWEKEDLISEHFASARLLSVKTKVGGEDKSLLMLVSDREVYRNEFASVCAQFVDPGQDGLERTRLLEDPLKWWINWKLLLGNASIDKSPYSVLCEMIVLKHVLSFDTTAKWTASISGTHDIETDTRSFEVKSTKMRYGASITVSSQFQLLTPKQLELFFLRVEEAPSGVSINDLSEMLVSVGYDKYLLEDQLTKAGYEAGSSDRNKKYSILEKRVYKVDDSFPKITADSFKNGTIPPAITEINYTIDLDGITYEKW